MIHKFITNLNAEIEQKANTIAESVEKGTKNLIYLPQLRTDAGLGATPSPYSSSTSYKNLILLGSGGAAVGILGMLFSDSVKSWQVILTSVGAIFAGYGFMHNSKNSTTTDVEIDFTDVKNYYIDNLGAVLDKASKEWDQFIQSKNESLVNEIKSQITDEKLRSKALFKTYYLEGIKVSLLDYISDLDNIPKGDSSLIPFNSAKDAFAYAIKMAILEAAKNQTKQYSEIIELLESSANGETGISQ